jgi:hypothetical protein
VAAPPVNSEAKILYKLAIALCWYSEGLDDPILFPLCVSLLDSGSLVAHVLAAAQGNLDLDLVAVAEVRFDGDNRHPRRLGLLQHSSRLVTVHQQGAGPAFLVLKVLPRHAVLANVNIVQDAGPAVPGRPDVPVPQVQLAVADGLDLGPRQGDTGLERFQNLVVAVRQPIDGDDIPPL